MPSSILHNEIGLSNSSDLNAPLLEDTSHEEPPNSKKSEIIGASRDSISEPPNSTNRSLSVEGERDDQRGRSRTSLLRKAAVLLSRRGWKYYRLVKSKLGRHQSGHVGNDASNANITNGNEPPQQNSIKSSLSTSPTTHPILRLLLPPLLILNHILFFHAQTHPMWNLSYTIDMTLTATASSFKSKTAFDILNIPHYYEYVKKDSSVVQTFTYWDAIDKLWKGEGLGDAQSISKLSAVLLMVFSGIWPHLKLVLVQFCWFFKFHHKQKEDSVGRQHKSHTRRSPFLRILSIFGKWSLADVLVVCILIAVLHLDWEVDVDGIRDGVEEKLPVILSFVQNKYPDEVEDCKQLLNYECEIGHALVIHYPACIACETLIKNAFYHPEWTVGEGKDILDGITLEGGGYAQLRVVGMIGTYFFCGAVIMSILLSLVVDAVDELDRDRVDEEFNASQTNGEGGNDLRLTVDGSPNRMNQSGLHPPQNGVSSPLTSRSVQSSNFNTNYVPLHHPAPSPTTNSRLLKYTLMVVLSLISLPLVCIAVSLPTMERLVYGGIPTLLHEVLGMVWVKEYSLTSLVNTTGEAGGWDNFLMITFGMFVVVGPIVRSVALILRVLLGLPVALLGECIEQPRRRTSLRMFLFQLLSTLQNALRPFIDASGAFCSWEVLFVALIMIQAEMPSITDTIHEDDRCMEADPEHGRTCIEVQFNMKDNFLWVVIAMVVLVAASGLVMNLALNEADGDSPLDKSKTRYEYGMTIPHRTRANMSSDQSWKGALRDIDISEINSAMGEELTSSPLLRNEAIDETEPLEEIVFV